MTKRNPKPIEANWYWRWEVRQILGVSEPTLKRYLSLLLSDFPAEFDWVPRSRQFSQIHLHYLTVVRNLTTNTQNLEATRQRLHEEGFPDHDYEKSA